MYISAGHPLQSNGRFVNLFGDFSPLCATLLMIIRTLLIIVSFSHNCSVIMDYLFTKIAYKFFLFYTTLVVAIQAFNPKLKTDKNGIYIFDNANIEEGIKELDSVLVAFYSPKCRSCLEAESELEKVVKILSAKDVEVRVAKADVSQDKDRSNTMRKNLPKTLDQP